MDEPSVPGGTDPGSLGRRVLSRRRALGLDRDELARRAGIHPGYLEYVESHADAQPSAATRARLAAALETSVAWLQRAGAGSPPGSVGPPPGTPRLETLPREACLALLRAGGVGRAVFTGRRGPVALPVNFRVLDGRVVFRTDDGAIAAAVRERGTMSVEVDHLDEELGEGWSVLVSGEAELVDDPEGLALVVAQGVEPWAGGDRPLVVRLAVQEVTGRRILRSDPPAG